LITEEKIEEREKGLSRRCCPESQGGDTDPDRRKWVAGKNPARLLGLEAM
jgi:hypothetical protein